MSLLVFAGLIALWAEIWALWAEGSVEEWSWDSCRERRSGLLLKERLSAVERGDGRDDSRMASQYQQAHWE